MKKLLAATALSAVLTTGLSAQTLEPVMSAQAIVSDTEVQAQGLWVPIMAMLFLLLTASSGSGSPMNYVLPNT